MAVQKQSLPSFASVISALSIVFYCIGFIRVEQELNQHKSRLNDLERHTESKQPSNDHADIALVHNALGESVNVLTLRGVDIMHPHTSWQLLLRFSYPDCDLLILDNHLQQFCTQQLGNSLWE